MRALLALFIVTLAGAAEPNRPDIVVVLVDDLGMGDVSALSMNCRIRTPYLDGFASEGMRLRDFHSASAFGSPTRYGLLTGRYGWRVRPVGTAPFAAPVIPVERPTVASVLRAQGYRTLLIGKWDLGLGWIRDKDGKPDLAQPFSGGPLALGFETFFGLAGSPDTAPRAWLEGDRVAPGLPEPRADELLEPLTLRAIAELRRCREDGRPLFLVIALPAPRAGTQPSKAWRGRSAMNAHADLVMETDNDIGRILMALRETQRAENALVVITSDNGASPASDFAALAAFGHHPSAGFRGSKGELYEGGHRVPTLVRWPRVIARGSASDALAVTTDLYATFLEVAGTKPPVGLGGEDSVSLLPVLNGTAPLVRESAIHHAADGSLALRKGRMKLLAAPATAARPGSASSQLFDLLEDPAEQVDLSMARTDEVDELRDELVRQVKSGRSTPGPASVNEVKVVVGGG